jgi:DNA-binding transcriptional MerR regulator
MVSKRIETMDELFSITELAKVLGITPRTIRFYEDRGLVTPRRVGTTRVYSHRDRARMTLVLRGKRLGFSLRDIKEYLDLYDIEPTHAEQIQLLQGKVRARIALLEDQRKALEETLLELRDIERQTEVALSKSA